MTLTYLNSEYVSLLLVLQSFSFLLFYETLNTVLVSQRFFSFLLFSLQGHKSCPRPEASGADSSVFPPSYWQYCDHLLYFFHHIWNIRHSGEISSFFAVAVFV